AHDRADGGEVADELEAGGQSVGPAVVVHEGVALGVGGTGPVVGRHLGPGGGRLTRDLARRAASLGVVVEVQQTLLVVAGHALAASVALDTLGGLTGQAAALLGGRARHDARHVAAEQTGHLLLVGGLQPALFGHGGFGGADVVL